MLSLDSTIVLVGVTASFFLNVFITIFFYRRTLRSIEKREIKQSQSAQQSQNESDIQNILNNRLLEIQNRRYSIQPKIRGPHGT